MFLVIKCHINQADDIWTNLSVKTFSFEYASDTEETLNRCSVIEIYRRLGVDKVN